MKAMILSRQSSIETSPLQLTEMEIPTLRPREILIKVSCCAICRTDLHIIEGELPPIQLPIIPGHQIVGTVVQLGEQSNRFKLGDKVGIAWLRYTCGQCLFCSTGRENLCENALFTGYHHHGGYAEYTKVDERFAYKLPETIDDANMAPLLCAGIIGYRAWKKAKRDSQFILALYGFGASAHIVLQIAKAKNVTVFVVSQRGNHQELAKQLGADWAGSDPSNMPDLPDSAIIFAPNGQIIPTALRYIRKGGRVVLTGIYMSDVPSLTYQTHLFYEKELVSVTSNTREDGEELIREAVTIPIRTHIETAPLKEANELLLKLKTGSLNGSGVLVMREKT